MKYSMPPVISDNCKILILGSLPGERSLQLQEYYAHPQNQFWRIICAILNEPMPNGYDSKKQLLLSHSIALWDVVHSARRDDSSLDSKIKNAVPNDLGSLLSKYKNIQRILLNGGKANSLFKMYFKHLDIKAVAVPSTSPAYASMCIGDKMKLWMNAIYIGGEKRGQVCG